MDLELEGHACLISCPFWTECQKCGKVIDVICLDFAKVFVKVPHQRLLHKLAKYGVGGKLLQWIKIWLTNRS